MGQMETSSRVLRDYQKILSLIKTVSILRHNKREVDSTGQIVSTVDDYETVRELINDIYVDSSTGITDAVRELIDAVANLEKQMAGQEKITNTMISKNIGKSVMQVRRYATKAIKQGWLINRETIKNRPADYVLGEPMPEVKGLPALTENQHVNGGGVTTSDNNIGRVNTLTGVTVENREVSACNRINEGAPISAGVNDSLSPVTDPCLSKLGITRLEAVNFHRSKGAPPIYIAHQIVLFETEGLEEFLDKQNLPEHWAALKQWFEKQGFQSASASRTGASMSDFDAQIIEVGCGSPVASDDVLKLHRDQRDAILGVSWQVAKELDLEFDKTVIYTADGICIRNLDCLDDPDCPEKYLRAIRAWLDSLGSK
jgi:hypothetical protein